MRRIKMKILECQWLKSWIKHVVLLKDGIKGRSQHQIPTEWWKVTGCLTIKKFVQQFLRLKERNLKHLIKSVQANIEHEQKSVAANTVSELPKGSNSLMKMKLNQDLDSIITNRTQARLQNIYLNLKAWIICLTIEF